MYTCKNSLNCVNVLWSVFFALHVHMTTTLLLLLLLLITPVSCSFHWNEKLLIAVKCLLLFLCFVGGNWHMIRRPLFAFEL